MFAIIMLVLAFVWADDARAQTVLAAAPAFTTLEEIYTIRNIAADETAETAAAARDIALQAARRVAFSRLSRRIVPMRDIARVPSLADEALANLIRDFEVAGEKSRGQRYIANLTMRFDPDKFRTLLQRLNISVSETGAKAMLIIPVYDGPAGRALWEQNPWRDALGAAVASIGAADDRLAPLLMPLGDAEDVLALTGDQALATDMQRLGLLIRRYGVGGVLLMHAVQGPALGAAGGLVFDITLRRIGVADENTRVERFEGNPGETAESILQRASQALTGSLEEAWLTDTAVDFSQVASLDIVAPVASFEQWLSLRKNLTAAPMVRHIDLQALSVSGAELNINYLGTPERLASTLSQYGLTLTQEAGKWVLR